MKTPTTRAGVKKYDHFTPAAAVLAAWNNPGNNPKYHERRKQEVRKGMPVLARALDRMTKTGLMGEFKVDLEDTIPQQPRHIYRIENPVTGRGMWYDQDGNLDPFITTLTEGKSAGLPMDPHERYGTRGRRWYSGGGSYEQMHHWFSEQDVLELYAAGYRLYRFTSTEYVVEQHQVIFTREGVVDQTELPLATVWPGLVVTPKKGE